MALSSIMTGALLSANTSRQMARVQSAVKSRMDGHAGVLDSEIKLDSARGGDTKKKQEELDELQKKASELAETTINTLTTANEDLKKAAKEDQEVQRAEKAAEKKKAEKTAEKKKAAKEAADDRIEKIAENSGIADTVQTISSESKMHDSQSIDIVVDSVTPSATSTENIGLKLDLKV